jgi:hypothetical protein
MKIPQHLLSLSATCLLVLLICYNNLSRMPNNIISWDVYGYYLYLPQTFIQDDLALQDVESTMALMKQYNSSATFYQAERLPNGNQVMKYTMGMAVAYSPFFAIGHQIAKSSGQPADGYSKPYQDSLLAAVIFYAILGVFFLRGALVRVFPDHIAAILLLAVTVGTNYYLHVTSGGAGAMSHNFLFTSYAAILYFTLRWHAQQSWWHALGIGLSCGLTILARPTELVCLFIPLAWGVHSLPTLGAKISLLLSRWSHFLTVALTIFALGFMQLAYWKYVSGNWLVDSYGGNPGEGLDLDRPHLLKVLFSFRKGWLVYTPIMGFAVLGLVTLYRRQRSYFWPVMLYFFVNLYIVSCWSTWYYAQSFSQRALIPSYAILTIPFGFLLMRVLERPRVLQLLVLVLLAAFTYLNLFQTWQYRVEILSPNRMTWDYYWRVFLKTDRDYKDERLLLVKRSADSEEKIEYPDQYATVRHIHYDFEYAEIYTDSMAYLGRRCEVTDSTREFGHGMKAPYHELTDQDHAWLRCSAWVYSETDSVQPALVVHFSHNDKPYKYAAWTVPSGVIRAGKWTKIQFDYQTPEVRNESDLLTFYVWNRTKKRVYIDELDIEVLERVNLR